MNDVLKIITDESLTYNQQLLQLARLGESLDHTIARSPELKKAMKDGIICDLGEGNAPYRPRYICPDYSILMKSGCTFLALPKPTDLWEACNSLLIMYAHVPSITSFPVYLGDLDVLLDRFVQKLPRNEAKKCLRLFLTQIDRTLTDSFVHANIGPKDTLTGRLLLELTMEMQLAVPNLTLKYDPKLTSDEFANLCATCMLKTAKPSFANYRLYRDDWGKDFAIASCYNGLKVGGGGFTLPRLRMFEMAKKAKNPDQFIKETLPKYTHLILKMMDDRIAFLVETSSFFKSNFLVKEGFIQLDNFTGMVGVVGLAECVNHLLNIADPKQGYGYHQDADDLAIKIMNKLEKLVGKHKAKYARAFNHRYRLHAQVGIDSDGRENSPGVRIPIGSEPQLLEQIQHASKFHHYFPTGVGDIFKFEETWIKTPDALVDIIRGALGSGMRYFSGYLASNDVVRVTGYLVKKSELEKLDKGQQSLNQVSIFGKGARDASSALDRKVNKKVK